MTSTIITIWLILGLIAAIGAVHQHIRNYNAITVANLGGFLGLVALGPISFMFYLYYGIYSKIRNHVIYTPKK